MALGTPSEIRLMRNADIFGDQIVFQYAADLWIMDRKDGIARRLTSHPGVEGRPRFSADGTQIAFSGTYDGNADLFVVSSKGGEPKRLTFMGTPEIPLDWTPDGRIAFTSQFGSKSDRILGMHTIGVNGGVPTRTALEEVFDASFSPDGKQVAFNRNNSHTFNWRRYRGGTQGKISFYDFEANRYWEIPSKRENRWQPMWVGDSVYYIGDKDFGTRNLFRWDTKTNRETRLTNFRDADIKNPQNDGKTIIWDRNGVLETFDIATGQVTSVKAFIGSDFLAARPRLVNLGNAISGIGLGPSGARIAVEARGDIFSVPARSGETRNLTKSQGVRERAPQWSPDGRVISYLSDRSGEVQLVTQPQMGGEETTHKVDPLIQNYVWSPDGKTISYQTRDGKLMLLNPVTGAQTEVMRQKWQSGTAYDWSPDSEWIVYTKIQDNLQGAIFIYNVATKESKRVTEGYFDDGQVTWDQNGRFIYFISGRVFQINPGTFELMMNMGDSQRVYYIALDKDTANPMATPGDEEPVTEEPKPAAPSGGSAAQAAAGSVPPAAAATPAAGSAPAAPAAPAKPKIKIDFDGIEQRITALPWPAGSYPFVLGVNNGVLTYAGGVLQLWSWQARQPLPIYQGPLLGLSFNAKRNRMAVNTGQGISILAVAPGQDPNAGRVNTSQVEMMWDPQAEWKQIYWEAWRFQRDVFYDPKMLGLDWNAIGKQYAEWLPYVKHRSDLNYLLGNMVGELGTGHAYVSGGDMGDMGRPVPVGHLGADYRVVGNNVQFAKIYPGLQFEEGRRGPLGELGVNVKEGDFLLEIDGERVSRTVDPHSLLQGKVGRTVTLTVNSTSSLTGARKVRVRPVGSESELRYISWVEGNRAYVNKKSNGQIGYLHVPDTSIGGIIEFIKGFYSQTDKKAWIIDERYNGGGSIPTFFVEFLRREVEAAMKARDWADIKFPPGNFDGPKAMLINEYAGSGGDMLPWLFRQSKLGPLIGTRTWGGLVGIQGGAPLVDGGNVTSPGFGIYDPYKGEWIAENVGIDPDIEVDARPDLVARGLDPQLDRAIEHLQGELRKPQKQFRQPAFPRPRPGQ